MNTLLMIAGSLVVATAIASVGADYHHQNDIPHYTFKYVVSDPHTGDNKAQWETRHGNVVKGAYSLIEPDGTLRVVDYKADDHNGFNADVKKIGLAVHPPVLITKTVPPLTSVSGPVKLPIVTLLRRPSIPWDSITHSYGGWVPRIVHPSPKKLYLTILTKQRDHYGNLHHWISPPMRLNGRKIKVKH